MKRLWIVMTAALGLSFWPAAHAHADWEDVQDEREDVLEERADLLEEMADEGYFPATRVYVPTRRVYLDDGDRVIIKRERPVVREYHRTYFIDD